MATQKEIQEAYDRKVRNQAFSALPLSQQIGEGVVREADRLQQGVRGLLGGMPFPTLMGKREVPAPTPEEAYRLKRSDEIDSLPAAIGGAGFDMATLAIPGAGLARIAQLPGKAAYHGGRLTRALDRIRRSSPVLAAETGLTAAYEGAKAPGEGETRLGNAGQAAAWQAGLGVVGPIARARNAAKITDEGAQMMARDVPLTPGMARDDWTTGIERRMGELPLAGPRVTKLQDEAQRVWNVNTLNDVRPPKTPKIKDAGFDGFKQIQAQYKDGYQDAWSSITPDNVKLKPFADDTAKLSASFKSRLPPEEAAKAQTLLNRARQDVVAFVRSGDPLILGSLDDTLRDAAGPDEMLLREAYGQIRDSMRRMLPKEADKAIRQLDGQYRKYVAVQSAAHRVRAGERQGVITPRDMQTGVKTSSTPREFVRGEGPMQAEATLANNTIARVLPERSQINVGGDVAPYILTSAATSRPGVVGTILGTSAGMAREPMRRWMLGEMPNQMSVISHLLRAGRTGTATSNN